MGKKLAKVNFTWMLYSILAVLLLFLTGVFLHIIFKASWAKHIVVTNEIKFFDVFNLIATSSVTIWIGWYIGKKVGEKRYEKDYVIDDLKEIEKGIRNIESLTNNRKKIELDELLLELNKLRIYLDTFHATVSTFEISKVDPNNLNLHHKLLFIKLSNLPGKILEPDDVFKNEINLMYSEFIKATRATIFRINKN